MIKKPALLLIFVALAACSNLPFSKPDWSGTQSPSTRPQTSPLSEGAIRPPAGAKTAAALDTTTAAEKAEALAAASQPAAEKTLGKTVVSLGNVTEPGFWLRSALVTAAAKGRVVTDGGASLQVDLIPGEGAAQLSLAAFRALNLPLTGLPEVTILAR